MGFKFNKIQSNVIDLANSLNLITITFSLNFIKLQEADKELDVIKELSKFLNTTGASKNMPYRIITSQTAKPVYAELNSMTYTDIGTNLIASSYYDLIKHIYVFIRNLVEWSNNKNLYPYFLDTTINGNNKCEFKEARMGHYELHNAYLQKIIFKNVSFDDIIFLTNTTVTHVFENVSVNSIYCPYPLNEYNIKWRNCNILKTITLPVNHSYKDYEF